MPKSALRFRIETQIEQRIHEDPMVRDEPDLRHRRLVLLRYHMNEAYRRARDHRDDIDEIVPVAPTEEALRIAIGLRKSLRKKVEHYTRAADTLRRMLRTA